jgi:DNA-binding GntR family transcriptional regulator
MNCGGPAAARNSCLRAPHFALELKNKQDAPMSLSQITVNSDTSHEDRAQAIRDTLRDAIVDRRLAPGTKLSESEVGTLFDVSRTVVRAALQMLAYEGLVKAERNRGAFVSNPTPDEARQVFASRRLIEPGVVDAAIEKITPAAVTRLREHLVQESRHQHERGPSARRAEIKASGDFHLMLASLAGNAILEKFMDELVARSSLVIALYGRSGVSSCGHNDHADLLDALEVKDTAKARALMLQHLDHIEADLDLRMMEGLALKDALAL